MTDIVHADFTLTRHYSASPSRVHHALTESEARVRWLISSDGFSVLEYAPPTEVVAGAQEHSRFSPREGEVEITNDTTWLDIAEDRLIFACAMTLDGAALSSSLVTITLAPQDGGTFMNFTEQGAYLNGSFDGREGGTRGLLDALEMELNRHQSGMPDF
jgi:uncharacterized protein YndB with AHSA1/START domain